MSKRKNEELLKAIKKRKDLDEKIAKIQLQGLQGDSSEFSESSDSDDDNIQGGGLVNYSDDSEEGKTLNYFPFKIFVSFRNKENQRKSSLHVVDRSSAYI